MDTATAKVTAVATTANLQTLKEPIGFIKLLQFVLSIFAFASCAGSGVDFTVDIKCPNEIKQVSAAFAYPFIFHDVSVQWQKCDNNTPMSTQVPGNFSSQSEYFVAIGVLCFLYSIVALGIYIFCDKLYRSNDKLPIADFLITAFLAAMWLISSSVWASGVTGMKTILDEDYLLNKLHALGEYCKMAHITCKLTREANFASENISVIFGFLNLVVWGGNLWFLYKETAWFKVRSRPPDDQTVEPQKA